MTPAEFAVLRAIRRPWSKWDILDALTEAINVGIAAGSETIRVVMPTRELDKFKAVASEGCWGVDERRIVDSEHVELVLGPQAYCAFTPHYRSEGSSIPLTGVEYRELLSRLKPLSDDDLRVIFVNEFDNAATANRTPVINVPRHALEAVVKYAAGLGWAALASTQHIEPLTATSTLDERARMYSTWLVDMMQMSDAEHAQWRAQCAVLWPDAPALDVASEV